MLRELGTGGHSCSSDKPGHVSVSPELHRQVGVRAGTVPDFGRDAPGNSKRETASKAGKDRSLRRVRKIELATTMAPAMEVTASGMTASEMTSRMAMPAEMSGTHGCGRRRD
jgi:hypothetical protein